MIRQGSEAYSVDAAACASCRLVIHHHAVAHESGGTIWVQSFIGAWVKELARHFEHVGLLLSTSRERTVQQDVPINEPNVTLHSLGVPAQRHRRERNRRIQQLCADVAKTYDVLLIRGITPRQMLVYRHCRTGARAFLLVGSLVDSRPQLTFGLQGLLTLMMHRRRRRELRRISRGSVMLANSPSVVRELRSEYGIEAAFVPTNTISRLEFAPFERRRLSSRREILFCGRVVREKGIEELIAAIGLLRQRGMECQLTVVGGVSAEYRARLDHIAARHAVFTQVSFRNFVPFGESLLALYRKADVYVLPSWHEGFPHTLWEAAASGTPIVSTRVGGIPGLLSDREALFTEAQRPESLALGISQAFEDYEASGDRAANAYDFALAHTVERCAELTAERLTEEWRRSKRTGRVEV